ncbi:hypothetical protein [Fibrobacter sp. UWB1]|uniref:hypothetical protein n=1 Tax=Fibrobacter sp. UWB1 TaxID=1964355 RepID=UPI0014838455|nr:hypothetical protein [Fibrobacter sp. UWB1]
MQSKSGIFTNMSTAAKNLRIYSELKYPEHSGELFEAVEEAKRLEANPKTKRYTDMDEMWADLDK